MNCILKKIVGLSVVCCFGLNANAFNYDNNFTIGVSGLKMDYTEVDSSGSFLDKDSSNLSDIVGIEASLSFPLSKNFNGNIYGSYHNGSSSYDGATWGGTPLSFTHTDVTIINMEGTIDYDLIEKSHSSPLSMKIKTGLGYRNWDRGMSDYVGSYNEIYSWAYGIIGTNLSYDLNKNVNIGLNFDYKKSFYGNLEIGLDSKTNLALDNVDGMTFSIPVEYKISNSFSLITEAKYEIWNIKQSDPKNVVISGTPVTIFEPESETKNTYLGIKAKFSF